MNILKTMISRSIMGIRYVYGRRIRPYAEIRDCRRQVILSHYPVFCYKGQYRITPEGDPLTYMLYGHVHNTHDERLVNEFIRITRSTMVKSARQTQEHPIPCNMINCFCMFSNYIPLTLDDWIRLDKGRRERMKLEKKALKQLMNELHDGKESGEEGYIPSENVYAHFCSKMENLR